MTLFPTSFPKIIISRYDLTKSKELKFEWFLYQVEEQEHALFIDSPIGTLNNISYLIMEKQEKWIIIGVKNDW